MTDDPSKDSVGTVRRSGHGVVVVKIACSRPFREGWERLDGGGRHSNDWVSDWEVLGSIRDLERTARR